MISCICANQSETEIRELIKSGHNTIDKLRDVARICDGCQMCHPYVLEYIKEEDA
jgi:bacterioferritin-associated ferredoxin